MSNDDVGAARHNLASDDFRIIWRAILSIAQQSNGTPERTAQPAQFRNRIRYGVKQIRTIRLSRRLAVGDGCNDHLVDGASSWRCQQRCDGKQQQARRAVDKSKHDAK